MKHTRLCTYYAFLLMLAISGSLIATNNQHSRKTFMAPRSVGVNLPMEYTTWHDHVYPSSEPRHHSNIQVTGFFQGSTNKADIGQYFGIGNGKNSFTVGTAADVLAHTADIDNRFLIHSNNNVAEPNTLADTVVFRPRQNAWGVRFDYFQDINHPICGLFFKASLPIAWIDRRVISDKDQPASGTTFRDFSVRDFFAGKVDVSPETDPNDAQSALTKAKIAGRHQAGGVADIDLALGYKCLNSETHHLYLTMGITIPTGNRVRGEYLFEPIYGNGRHFGLGAGIDAGMQVWCNDKAQAKALLAASYRYLFQGTEVRTVGLTNIPFGQYFLAGQNGQSNTIAIFPAANVLTRDIAVKPGSQLDMLVGLSFLSSNFVIDVGYNMFWKDQESAWIKSWQDNRFAIIDKTYDQNVADFINFATAGTIFKVLNLSDLDTQSFVTPSILTHKIFAGMSYSAAWFHSYPCSLGIGASYEFATTNADLENYALWAKVNFSF